MPTSRKNLECRSGAKSSFGCVGVWSQYRGVKIETKGAKVAGGGKLYSGIVTSYAPIRHGGCRSRRALGQGQLLGLPTGSRSSRSPRIHQRRHQRPRPRPPRLLISDRAPFLPVTSTQAIINLARLEWPGLAMTFPAASFASALAHGIAYEAEDTLNIETSFAPSPTDTTRSHPSLRIRLTKAFPLDTPARVIST